MSTYLAIGGVSKTLRALLRDRMDLPAASVKVTVQTPKANGNGSDPDPDLDPRVNLFLYSVTENPHLKNQEIPGHGHPGTYGKPPLSLDLHYLMTAYGHTTDDSDSQNEALAQQVLGSAMRVLHDYPVITDELVDSNGDPILDSELHDAYERVRLTLSPISLEDLSKVWTALESPYRLSVAYKVNVVQIESKQPRRYPKPVGEPKGEGPRVVTTPFQGPRIEQLLVIRKDETQERTVPYARIDDTLVLKGRNLGGLTSRAFIGDVEVSIVQDTMTPDRVEIVIPDEDALQPGTHAVRVVQDVMLGDPPEPHRGFRSNIAPFVLVPSIGSATTPVLVGDSWKLSVSGSRLWEVAMPGEVLVGELAIPKPESGGTWTPAEVRVEFRELPNWRIWPAIRLVSAELGDAVALEPGEHKIQVQMGAETRTAVFQVPEGDPPGAPVDVALTALAGLLEEAIRDASGLRAFGTTMAIAAEGQLHLFTCDRSIPVLVSEAVDDAVTAGALGLTAATGRTEEWAHVSGDLSVFPVLAKGEHCINVTVGATPMTATISSGASSVAEVASELDACIHAATGAHLVAHRDRLVLFVDSGATVSFEPVAGVDETTVYDLRLLESLAVRVRVNGAESFDDTTVILS